MLVLILLQTVALIVEGGALPNLRGNERHLPLSTKNNDENVVENDRLNPKFFENMFNANHELTAVESNQRTSEFQIGNSASSPTNDVSFNDEETMQFLSIPELKRLMETQDTFIVLPENPKDDIVLVVVPDHKSSRKALLHHRQRRFISAKQLRVIAVPLSVFNFLGFLPIKVPGLPYHDDLPPPDYTYYNTKQELTYPDRIKYF